MNARNIVLWSGNRDDRGDPIEFTRRQLDLRVIDGADLDGKDFLGARGIVYAVGPGQVDVGADFIARTIRPAIDHGLFVMVIVEEDSIYAFLKDELDKLGVPLVKFRTGDADGVPDHEIAQTMLTAPVQLAVSPKLVIEPSPEALNISETDELLLRRAFADCKQIRVRELGGGRTAETFMIDATFEGSLVGPKPLPFFAKLGRRDKIECEATRYADFATHYIPFHLRPNLDPKRCLLGFDRGILVGNFVERAEPLWQVAEQGKAHGAIHSLVDTTLAGWRAQGFESPGGASRGAVAGALSRGIFDFNKVKADILTLAKGMGLTREPRELWAKLLGSTWQHYYKAPMHADLHPGNVFVRSVDAILIDLASVQHGPLSGDLACLETSLTFETRDGDDEMSFDEWQRGIDPLYASDAFKRVPPPMRGSSKWAARWNCARQVRMLALPTQACETEYLSAVAVYLLRRGMYPGGTELDVQRRAYALVIADRLVSELKEQPC